METTLPLVVQVVLAMVTQLPSHMQGVLNLKTIGGGGGGAGQGFNAAATSGSRPSRFVSDSVGIGGEDDDQRSYSGTISGGQGGTGGAFRSTRKIPVVEVHGLNQAVLLRSHKVLLAVVQGVERREALS